jgi:hypothetical protein
LRAGLGRESDSWRQISRESLREKATASAARLRPPSLRHAPPGRRMQPCRVGGTATQALLTGLPSCQPLWAHDSPRRSFGSRLNLFSCQHPIQRPVPSSHDQQKERSAQHAKSVRASWAMLQTRSPSFSVDCRTSGPSLSGRTARLVESETPDSHLFFHVLAGVFQGSLRGGPASRDNLERRFHRTPEPAHLRNVGHYDSVQRVFISSLD